MSEGQDQDLRHLLEQREPPNGLEVQSWRGMPYKTYGWRFHQMRRYYLAGIYRDGYQHGEGDRGAWRRPSFYLPDVHRVARGMQGLAVELEHWDVHPMKRTARPIPYLRGIAGQRQPYAGRRMWGQGAVRVEMIPTEGVLRLDGYYDGDTLLSVTYAPAGMIDRDGTFRRPQPIVLIPPTSLAVLRESQYFADDVWKAAESRVMPWDLDREE